MNHPIKETTEKEIILNDKEIRKIHLEKNETYRITGKKDSEAYLFFLGENVDVNLEIVLEENSKMTFSFFLKNGNGNATVHLIGEESAIEYRQSVIANQKSNHRIWIYHENRKTVSKTYCNGYSQDGAEIIFDVNGCVTKNSNQCICTQDSKIVQKEKSNSQIHPKLFIDNYDVEASHSAYLGPWQEETLFYLESRGIKKEIATKLLTKGLLLGNLRIDEEARKEAIEMIERMEENIQK